MLSGGHFQHRLVLALALVGIETLALRHKLVLARLNMLEKEVAVAVSPH